MTTITSNTIIETIIPLGCSSDSDCPCGQACVGGTCQGLIPAIMNVSSPVTKYPFWMAYDDCTGGGCSGFEGENLDACNFGSGLCNSTLYTFTVTGSVTDSNGHPVCGVPLNFTGKGIGKIPFSTPYTEGYWEWGLGIDEETDSNGEFSMTITINMTLTAVSSTCGVPIVSPIPPQNIIKSPYTFSFTVSATGYVNVSALVLFEINNTICQQNAF